MLTYNLDRTQGKSLYALLCDCIRADIADGALAAGQKLPSKRALAAHLGVSLATVEAAYTQLGAEGYVRAQPRRGFFVCAVTEAPRQGGATPLPGQRSRESGRQGAASQGAASGAPGSERPGRTMLNLSSSAPLPGTMPEKAWFKTMREVMNQEDPAQLLDAHPQGMLRLRQAIAAHLQGFRGIHANPQDIVVGAGAQYLYLLLAQLLDRTATWAVEDPGYARLRQIYRAEGLAVACLPLDGQGLDVARLRASGASVAHITPSHQFPTGTVMSAARRYQLLAWASEGDRYIIEDDYDCEFRLRGMPMPSLKGIDALQRVIYVNTFSSSLWPGVRIAYLVLPPALSALFRQQLGFYSCTVSAMEQLTLARFMETGRFDSQVNRLRKRSRDVRDALLEGLEPFCQRGLLRVAAADAGLHFLVEVPGVDEQALRQALRRQGMQAAFLGDCFGDAANRIPGSPATLLVNHAGFTPQTGRQAMGQLGRLVENVSGAQKGIV